MNPKTWSPPWPLKVPDWPEVWFCVYRDGEANFISEEPFMDESDTETWWSMGGSKIVEAGYFEIPPGMDWREMKVRVR